jgi:hypothetical protein
MCAGILRLTIWAPQPQPHLLAIVPLPSPNCSFHEVLNRGFTFAHTLKFRALEFDQAVNLGLVVHHFYSKILPERFPPRLLAIW